MSSIGLAAMLMFNHGLGPAWPDGDYLDYAKDDQDEVVMGIVNVILAANRR